MVELHLAFEYGLMQLPLHHDNVSLRLHFEYKFKVALMRSQANRRIRRICTHLVLSKMSHRNGLY